MINLIIFLICFILWLNLVINRKFEFYTHVLAFIWGCFLAETIKWICGIQTLIF